MWCLVCLGINKVSIYADVIGRRTVMGCYVNVKGEDKAEWLMNNMESFEFYPIKEIPEDCMQVCLVDNLAFTAAAVILSERDMEEFSNPKDYRAKLWFIVKTEKLKTVSPMENYIK